MAITSVTTQGMAANLARQAETARVNVRSLNEECGIFGVWGRQDAAQLTYYGLHALQHRGQEGAGIVSNHNGHLWQERGLGLLSDVFRDPTRLKGWLAKVLSGMSVTQRLVLTALKTFNP